MHRVLLCGLALCPLAGAADDRPDRRADPKLQVQINRAIERGVAYVKKTQGKPGCWRYSRDTGTGGLTALALYALAASRVAPDDPTIVKGISWTEKHRQPFQEDGGYGTYSASLLVLALTRIDPKAHKQRIDILAERIWRSQLPSDMWTYSLRAQRRTRSKKKARKDSRTWLGGGDNSNSQFAVLALWAACALANAEVPPETWQRVHDFYRRTQAANGSWNYTPVRGGGPGRPTMTAAGLVSYVYASAAMSGGIRTLPQARRTPAAQAGTKALFHQRFDFHHYKPARRREVLYEFGKAGAPAVGLFIQKLRHKQVAVRATATELLRELVERRFLFEPRWPAQDRAHMLQSIDEFWQRCQNRLHWDAQRRRFVVR